MELKEMLINKTLERIAHDWDEPTLALFHLCVAMVKAQDSQQGRERKRVCSGKEQDILTDSPLTTVFNEPKELAQDIINDPLLPEKWK